MLFRSMLEGLKALNVSGQIVTAPGGDPNIYISPTCDFSDLAAGGTISSNLVPKQVASAATVPLPAFDDFYAITGTTNISQISGGWKGRRVTFLFGGAVTLTSGAGGVNGLRLAAGANVTVGAGSTLSLIHNGFGWFETARAA